MREIKLNDVCDVRDGTHDSPKYVMEGYPLVTSKNIVDGKIDISNVNYISREDYEAINKRSKVDDGDILMPMIGTIGKPIIVEKEYDFAIKNVALIKFNKDSEVTSKYIRYVLDSNLFKRYIERENRGGTQKFLSLGNIRNFDLPLISVAEQNKITNILDKTSRLIERRKEMLGLLDDLIKSRFVEMFGDPKENPKGWDEVSVTDILGGKTSNGFFAKRDDYCDDGNVSVLGVADIVNRMYSEVNDLPRTNAVDKDIEKYEVKYGDILFCRSSLVAEGIGKASIVPLNSPRKILFECHVIRLQLDLTKCVPEYIQMLTTTDYFRNQVLRHAKTSTMTTIGQDGIVNNLVVLPPLIEQQKFFEFIGHVDKLKLLVQTSLDDTQMLFDSLMQDYFD